MTVTESRVGHHEGGTAGRGGAGLPRHRLGQHPPDAILVNVPSAACPAFTGVLDLAITFYDLGVNITDLETFVQHIEVAPATEVPEYPVPA